VISIWIYYYDYLFPINLSYIISPQVLNFWSKTLLSSMVGSLLGEGIKNQTGEKIGMVYMR
jgi:hypothetical protein